MGLFKIVTKPLGCLFSLAGIILAIVIALLVLALLSFNYVLPTVIDQQISSRTDFSAHVEASKSKLWDGRLVLKDFSINNPAGYSTSDFVLFNELVGDVDLDSVRSDTLVVDEVVVDLARVTWVRDAEGVPNAMRFVDKLKASLGDEDAKPASEPQAEPETSKPEKKLLIRKLTVRVGKAIVVRDENEPRVYDLNYDRTFTDVTDPQVVAKSIATDLAGLGLNVFKDVLLDTVFDAKHLENLGKAAGAAAEAGQGALEEGAKTIEGAADTLKGLFK